MWMSGLIRCLNNLVDFASRKINDKRVKRNISEDFEGYIYLQKSGNIYQTLSQVQTPV